MSKMSQLHADLCQKYGDDPNDFDRDYTAEDWADEQAANAYAEECYAAATAEAARERVPQGFDEYVADAEVPF